MKDDDDVPVIELDGDIQPYEIFGGATLQRKRARSRTDRKANFRKRLAKRRKKQKQARRK